MKQTEIVEQFQRGELDFLQLTYQLSISVQASLEELAKTLPPEAATVLEVDQQMKEARQIAFLARKLLDTRPNE